MAVRVIRAVAVGAVMGTFATACGSGSNSGTGRLDNPTTLASAVQDSVQHKLPAGTTVTKVTCTNNQRLDYTCAVHFNTGPDRTMQVTVQPGGRSYVVTAGDL